MDSMQSKHKTSATLKKFKAAKSAAKVMSTVLFAQLPSASPENVQLDMTYSPLSLRILKRLSRDSIKTFHKLPSRTRVIKETFVKKIQTKVKPKLKERQAENLWHRIFKSNNAPTDTARIEVKAEHVGNSDTPKRATFSCFGHGAPGVIIVFGPIAEVSLSIDLRFRDWKIAVDESDRGKTCFASPLALKNKIREKQLEDPDVRRIGCFEGPSGTPDLANWLDQGYLINNGILYRPQSYELEHGAVSHSKRRRIMINLKLNVTV
ncbi:hypothetical protein ILUMI_20232 [Ignelater luminosus]|uniref:Uncharacterized protein n=1 Tax=Ignelater luminosus TaxID=2038154 RepID=A0A8K0CIV2_IGNLU|nr:hypothetical protein ILUMI_20232 [Ignelater luminosus]